MQEEFLKIQIFFFDEPTSSLDKASYEIFITTLNELKKNKIIFLVTHSNEMAYVSDEVYRLDEGTLSLDTNNQDLLM